MTITVTYGSQATVVQTLGGVFVSSSDNTVTASINTFATLTNTTTPPVIKDSEGRLSLSSGSVSGFGTIDLTSLPDRDGVAGQVTLLGLRLAVVKFRNKTTNANAITIAKGAGNGCTALGGSFSITLQVGEEVMFLCRNLAAVVDASHKIFDVTGTGNQVLEFQFVAG